MPQKPEGTLPLFLNTDVAFEKMLPSESPFIKGTEIGISKNPLTSTGNPTGEGQNALDISPTRSNSKIPGAIAPAGFNKNAGEFYSDTTRETYYANFNSNGDHGIYLLSGDTGQWSTVVIDKNLPFTENQKDYLKGHRWKLRVIYDKNGNILEKFLIASNGAGWQLYVSVIAAIKTNGFDASLYPYWTLLQPHYDRRELLELAVRPPMYNPLVAAIPNTPADQLLVNRIIDQAFQFAIVYNYTDGRPSTFSPYSLPLIVKSEDFLNNPDVLSKKALLTLYAGSCMIESIDLMVRYTAKKQIGIPSTEAWGDWQKYIRLYKFADSRGNTSDVLSSDYWLRTNPWLLYSYDPIQNTIQYVFDNTILPEITSKNNAIRIQNDLPLRSISNTDVNDALLLGDNLKGYNNLPASTMKNLDAEVVEKPNTVCPLPTRKVTLYAVAGRPNDHLTWESQVGYFDGEDTQVRWGSLGVNLNNTPVAAFNVAQSKEFGLDFADHSAFVCYAKGTPYYVVGEWFLVDASNNLTKLPALLDFSSNDVLSGVQTAFLSQKYYVCVFTFELPAGRYDFCIGRHNVNLTSDFRAVSTYMYGIANSRIRTTTYSGQASFVQPNAIVSYSKEMEIDCTNGDVDVWGNGHDLFFIYCPYPNTNGDHKFRFLEGYLKESPDNQLGMELFPYTLNIGGNDWGKVTDKNGFYWVYTNRSNSDTANVEVDCKLNCSFPFHFEIPTNASGAVLGPIQNGNAYITDHNSGKVGDCNRVLIRGKITDLSGNIPYSNISVSLANGSSTVTGSDGTFVLVAHNGQNNNRVDNIYVGAAGNFLITLDGCAPMPITAYNESLAPCFNCTVRNFPFPVNYKILIQGGTQFSVKQNATYQVTCHVADLAGRLGYENVIKTLPVTSFLERNDILATFFRAKINGPLKLDPDFAWIAFSVSNIINMSRYFQWVGDNIQFVDNQNNVVDDPSSAVFITISIASLYNFNVSKNFSTLAAYQFSPDDRIRFIDDGNGNLLNKPPFNGGIDLAVLGQTYNQAMQNAGIVPSTNTVPIVNTTINNNQQTNVSTGGDAPSTTVSFNTTQNNISPVLWVKFDPRLAALKDNTGFWVEIYTPAQEAQAIPYNELQWYPVINGEIAIFKGNNNGIPEFDFPTQFDIPFWDTYLYFRDITIPNVGDKFLNHPFESSNISDSFGANVSSGGRKWEKNDDAIQQWAQAEMIKSDAFVGNGIINGIGTFRSENSKNFAQYPVGAILGMHTERNIIAVICENDWFTVNFDFHFTYPNAQGVMVVNLDNNISTPTQKIGGNFGMRPEDTGTLIFFDKHIYWLDSKNESPVECDYRDARDLSDLKEEGRPIGVKSYFIKKIQYMTEWNLTAETKDRIDAIAGFDPVRRNIYFTFRPRRNNSNDPRSYVNQRRNIDLSQQETIVFSQSFGRWTRFQGFAPEGYALAKGDSTGLRMIMFAAGIPYGRGDENTPTFLSFFGVLTEPVFMTIFNKPADIAKVFQALSIDCNMSFFADLIFTGQRNSFSYIPVNFFQQKEGIFYSQILRDMYSYPKQGDDNMFRSMLWDGSRIVDVYAIFRFVVDPNKLGKYFELNNIFCTYTKNYPDKK